MFPQNSKGNKGNSDDCCTAFDSVAYQHCYYSIQFVSCACVGECEPPVVLLLATAKLRKTVHRHRQACAHNQTALGSATMLAENVDELTRL